ncbi:MAG: DUF4252 domain-containing protein [Bacteroidales bacterium]|nr:DUF4252 domain-containing protein [Bacteroidales bacterium]
MKKAAIIIAVFLFPALLSAQSATIDKLIAKYGGQEGVTVVNISPQLFQIMSEMDIEEIDDTGFDMKKLSAIKILSIENEELLEGYSFYEEVTADLNTDDFAELMTVKDGQDDVRMWMKTEGSQILEFLLVVSSPDEGVVVYINGDFSMNDIEGLAQSFGGLDQLDELNQLEIH